MEVILLTKVDNLGKLGDKVSVRPGYGRNYLIPQGKAVSVTPENLAEFERRREELEAAAASAVQSAESRAEALNGQRFEIAVRAGAEGKLYGSVGPADIASALTAAGYPIERREVRMPGDGPIHELGEYPVGLHLHTEVDASITVAVVAEE